MNEGDYGANKTEDIATSTQTTYTLQTHTNTLYTQGLGLFPKAVNVNGKPSKSEMLPKKIKAVKLGENKICVELN